MQADERFWQRVARGDSCWVWQGKPGPRGFGQVKLDGRPHLAHRAAWFFTYGEWPVGEVKQSCGNRLCVRPEHLEYEALPASALKPARRQRGSGSVEPRGSKVRIRASVRDPVTGRRLQPSFTVEPTRVKEEMERIRSELGDGRHRGTAATFGERLDKTLRVYVPTLTPGAQQTFRNYAKYLQPLRQYPLRRLEEHPEIVEEFYAAGVPGLRGDGKFLNPTSLRHVHWV
ncbi:MAG: HNH endonuclease, partial [Acidimicrobiia bacterium]